MTESSYAAPDGDTRTLVAEPKPVAAKPRENWADVAKGICIVLVVLWHAVTKHYQLIDWETSIPIPQAWTLLGVELLPLRMPLFFTISGLFAVGAVHRSWQVLWRTRVGKFALLYLIWLVIHTAVFWFTPDFDTAHASNPLQFLEYLTISPTNLWYLYALLLYFAIARITRRVPSSALLLTAFALSAAASAGLVPDGENRWQVLQNLFFFLAGLRLRDYLVRYVRQTGWLRMVALGVAYVVLLGAISLVDAQEWFGVWPVISALAVLVGIGGSVFIARTMPRTTDLLCWLGRRTLPIYVIHLPLIALLDLGLRGPLAFLEPVGALGAALVPAVLTAVAIALSLAFDRLLTALRLGRLTDPLPAR